MKLIMWRNIISGQWKWQWKYSVWLMKWQTIVTDDDDDINVW
jgi:hypothetical protein